MIMYCFTKTRPWLLAAVSLLFCLLSEKPVVGQTVIFKEYFNTTSAAGPDGYAWPSASPPGYGGVDPNPMGLRQENLSCNVYNVSRYQIARGASLGPNNSAWAPPSTNGCPFDNVRNARFGGNMFLMGALYDNGNGAPTGWGNKRLVWQTRQALQASHTYQFNALIGDLASDAGGGYGGGSGGILDLYESRFSVNVWCITVNGAGQPQLLWSGRIGSSGDNIQSNRFSPDQGTGDYVLGIEIVSNYTNCSQASNNSTSSSPCTAYPFQAAINYFGLASLTLVDLVEGLPTPRVAQALVGHCGPGPVTFTIVSPGGTSGTPLPANGSFEWYTKDNAGARQLLTTTTDPVFTVTMPTGLAYGTPATYYVVVVTTDGNRGQEVAVQAVWYATDATFTVDAAFSGPAPYLQGYNMQFVAAPGYDSYTWNWGSNAPDEMGTTNMITHIFSRSGAQTITLTVTKNHADVPGGPCSNTYVMSGLLIIAPLCEIQALSGGQFQQNTRSGAISYVSPPSSCLPAVSFECLDEHIAVPQVVAATATAFAEQLVAAPEPGTASNPYLAGQWRTTPQASYSFRTSLTPDPTPRNYSFGTFSLQPFNWESSLRARPAAWLTAAVTEQVSPQGDVLQEYDPLGIPSAAKFGYGVLVATPGAPGVLGKKPGRILPYLQAHNADYRAVLFESFENTYLEGGVVTVEDGLVLPSNVQIVSCNTADADPTACQAHTGSACALLTTRQLQLLPIPLTTQLTTGGLLIKVWLRLPDYDPGKFTAGVVLVRAGASSPPVPLTTTVRTGEWQLFEARVALNATGASPGESLTPLLQFSAGGASAVYVDDVRVQPAEAQMTAYVYDPVSLRLVASFDDQHFALRYQYNQEGKLIRKQAETARGLKTLQETHYHTPTTNQVNE